MTPPLAEAKSISPQIAQKSGDVTIDLSPPKPIGFNGGTTEKGIKKGTVHPIFTSLGELKVTSLNTDTNIGGIANTEINAGTDSCAHKSCRDTCHTCGGSCRPTSGCGSCGRSQCAACG